MGISKIHDIPVFYYITWMNLMNLTGSHMDKKEHQALR